MAQHPQIDWMIRKIMPQVLACDALSFPDAWNEERFLSFLRLRNCIGMVSHENWAISGFCIYTLQKRALLIDRLAVLPAFRGQGIGKALIDRLKQRLTGQNRTELIVEVKETRLRALQFLRSQGFCACDLIRSHFEDGRDAIEMRYLVDVEKLHSERFRDEAVT